MTPLEALGFRRQEGKTLTFWPTNASAASVVTDRHIDLLIDEADGANARLCLHTSAEALHHDMLILERRDSYFAPHRHSTKPETLSVLRGQLRAHIFRDNGEEARAFILMRGMIARIEPGVFHFNTPASDFVVYHESKPGPFLGPADREFAPWAGDELRERLLLRDSPPVRVLP